MKIILYIRRLKIRAEIFRGKKDKWICLLSAKRKRHAHILCGKQGAPDRPEGGSRYRCICCVFYMTFLPFFELNERILLFKYRIINELEVFFLLSECLAVRGMACSDQPASFACRNVSREAAPSVKKA